MRWKYETEDEKTKKKLLWHNWFAWYPVYFKGEAYWLETLEVRMYYYSGIFEHWEYRTLDHTKTWSK